MKKVLIVDDSALVRKQIKELISRLEFDVDIARNGQEAVDKAVQTQYDVITMDINMPEMDGLTAVKQIIQKAPTPILMVSSLTSEDAPVTIEAMELGAMDYIAKPGTFNIGVNDNGDDIVQKVLELSAITKQKLQRILRRNQSRTRTLTQHEPVKPVKQLGSRSVEKVMLIGASTGGPGLIEELCASIPESSSYTIFVVQHMPEKFTTSFTERLARTSNLPVVESQHNMEINPGTIYIAKGGTHLHFAKKVSGTIVLRLEESQRERFFKPSVDEMMLSALEVFPPRNLVGVLLTGIGDDGAQGMKAIKDAGAYTIGESESSATVYGMPKVAFEIGGVSEQMDFQEIVSKVKSLTRK